MRTVDAGDWAKAVCTKKNTRNIRLLLVCIMFVCNVVVVVLIVVVDVVVYTVAVIRSVLADVVLS